MSMEQQSSYLRHLPAIFQQEVGVDGASFLNRFLLATERILSAGDAERPGLEERIDRMHTYFDPGPAAPGATPAADERAPVEFLPWLASWVALTLREDWEEEEKRRFIGRIVPLYRLRGTKAGLEQMLHTYTRMGVEITEDEKRPHYFHVNMKLSERDQLLLRRKETIASAIIDREKPAHTYYELNIDVPTMQVGVSSTVGVDTLLGSP